MLTQLFRAVWVVVGCIPMEMGLGPVEADPPSDEPAPTRPAPSNPTSTPSTAPVMTPAPAHAGSPAQPDTDAEGGLMVGDPAPPIGISRWVQGEELAGLTPGRVYVLDFWATWRASCKRSQEALTRLQGANEPAKLCVIGVCGEDARGESIARVEAYLKKYEKLVGYRVGFDDDASTREAWLGGAGIMQIPAAFVVGPDGRIAWIGDPVAASGAMSRVIEELLAGRFDLGKAVTVAKAEAARKQAALKQAVELQARLRRAVQDDDAVEVAEICGQLIRLDGARYSRLAVLRYQAMLASNVEGARAWGRELLNDRLRDDDIGLSELAMAIVGLSARPGRDLELAAGAAARAVDLCDGQDAYALDTLARVQFERGEFAGAAATEAKAVDLSGAGPVGTSMREALKRYQAAAEEAAKAPAKKR